MSVVDPKQLLLAISPMLTPKGGVKTKDMLARLHRVIMRHPESVVCRCIYSLILKASSKDILKFLLDLDGDDMLKSWAFDCMKFPEIADVFRSLIDGLPEEAEATKGSLRALLESNVQSSKEHATSSGLKRASAACMEETATECGVRSESSVVKKKRKKGTEVKLGFPKVAKKKEKKRLLPKRLFDISTPETKDAIPLLSKVTQESVAADVAACMDGNKINICPEEAFLTLFENKDTAKESAAFSDDSDQTDTKIPQSSATTASAEESQGYTHCLQMDVTTVRQSNSSEVQLPEIPTCVKSVFRFGSSKPTKKVHWKPEAELRTFHYFELIPGERGNVFRGRQKASHFCAGSFSEFEDAEVIVSWKMVEVDIPGDRKPLLTPAEFGRYSNEKANRMNTLNAFVLPPQPGFTPESPSEPDSTYQVLEGSSEVRAIPLECPEYIFMGMLPYSQMQNGFNGNDNHVNYHMTNQGGPEYPQTTYPANISPQAQIQKQEHFLADPSQEQRGNNGRNPHLQGPRSKRAKIGFWNKAFGKRVVCRHYLRGYCREGDSCKFRHVHPKHSEKES